ncbi:hypothetical protein OG592_42640 (plasmid) [Streptomyces avidinii]|uniref:hypothetical protein n=1 Tax=Streptomyces avidinii TaxID=1895 RepID=UPI002F919E04|nr:hypothetical protein OG592_42640 [Streptomyces avidinii]
MSDFRAEALHVYRETGSADTRGIIAALLHLADTIAVRSATRHGPAAPDAPWKTAVITYLTGRPNCKENVYELARWLDKQPGFDVDRETIAKGMWDLVQQGRVDSVLINEHPCFTAPKPA